MSEGLFAADECQQGVVLASKEDAQRDGRLQSPPRVDSDLRESLQTEASASSYDECFPPLPSSDGGHVGGQRGRGRQGTADSHGPVLVHSQQGLYSERLQPGLQSGSPEGRQATAPLHGNDNDHSVAPDLSIEGKASIIGVSRTSDEHGALGGGGDPSLKFHVLGTGHTEAEEPKANGGMNWRNALEAGKPYADRKSRNFRPIIPNCCCGLTVEFKGVP